MGELMRGWVLGAFRFYQVHRGKVDASRSLRYSGRGGTLSFVFCDFVV